MVLNSKVGSSHQLHKEKKNVQNKEMFLYLFSFANLFLNCFSFHFAEYCKQYLPIFFKLFLIHIHG